MESDSVGLDQQRVEMKNIIDQSFDQDLPLVSIFVNQHGVLINTNSIRPENVIFLLAAVIDKISEDIKTIGDTRH